MSILAVFSHISFMRDTVTLETSANDKEGNNENRVKISFYFILQLNIKNSRFNHLKVLSNGAGGGWKVVSIDPF
jgi:hypothetical protein